MKDIMKLKCLFIFFVIIFTHYFSVYAIDFDAEQAFHSIFVIRSGNFVGSGFALGRQCVITNAHIIQNSDDIEIEAYNNELYSAVLYCINDNFDIAVLFVPTANFKSLSIGNNMDTKIGDDVYAIGSPSGMDYTLTKGTISSKNRTIGKNSYLQIDAALNGGNSGGPLLTDKGSVIGMNTMKLNNSEGIGLSIPIEQIVSYMNDNGIELQTNGEIEIYEKADKSQIAINSSKHRSETENSERMKKYNERNILLLLLCISIICNVSLFFIVIMYKLKYNRLKNKQSERTDFEIEILE